MSCLIFIGGGRTGGETALNPNVEPRARYIESAEPADMTDRINEALAELTAEGGLAPYSFCLTGAGDGHTFVASIGFAAAADFVGLGEPPSFADRAFRASAYMAATARELANARRLGFQSYLQEVAALGQSAQDFVGEVASGSSQGTRQMGVLLFGPPLGGP